MLALSAAWALAAPTPAPAKSHATMPTAGRPALRGMLAAADSLAAPDSLPADTLLGIDTTAVFDSIAVLDSLLADTSGVPDSLLRALPPLSAPRDYRTFRLELGGSTDISNEIFYEDTFDSTTFRRLGRHLVAAPETRVAAVAWAGLDGTRAAGRTRYALDNDLSLGDKVQREALDLSWNQRLHGAWSMRLMPRGEYRHDMTFGRDMTEWRGSASARMRRDFASLSSGFELGAGGEVWRANGPGSELTLDRNAGVVTAAVDHDGVAESWRLGYNLLARTFPDSSDRDHNEQDWEADWRHQFARGHWLAAQTDGARRHTWNDPMTTRDDFGQAHGAISGELEMTPRWALGATAGVEVYRYDRPDSTLFPDEDIWRGGLSARYLPRPLVSVSAGPYAELLASPMGPAEEYREIGGAVEFETFPSGSWWRIVPAVGRRFYRLEAERGRFDSPGLHTSFTYVQLDVLADQRLAARLRLRVLLTARLEAHDDPTEDSRSLYFSLDLRRLL
jgi:hypothetical protein